MIAGNNTDIFNIGPATVMIGPMDKVLELTPEEHSIGLVKNIQVTTETNSVSLTQGIRNVEVDSQITSITNTFTSEVYEYTAANMAYAAGLDGKEFSKSGSYFLAADVTGGESATTISVSADEDISSKFEAGSMMIMQSSTTEDYDKVLPVRVVSAVYEENKINVTLEDPIPLGWNFQEGDKVFTVNIIPVGSDSEQPYLGVKIVGVFPKSNKPCVIIFPKAKVTGGFTLSFTSENYGNMPFEIKPYVLSKTDSLYSHFKAISKPANFYVMPGN